VLRLLPASSCEAEQQVTVGVAETLDELPPAPVVRATWSMRSAARTHDHRSGPSEADLEAGDPAPDHMPPAAADGHQPPETDLPSPGSTAKSL
jgi:hypothetical protein